MSVHDEAGEKVKGGMQGREWGDLWKEALLDSSHKRLLVCVCVCGGDVDMSLMKFPFGSAEGLVCLAYHHIHSLMSCPEWGEEDVGRMGPRTPYLSSPAAGHSPPGLSRCPLGKCPSGQPGVGQTASSLPVEAFLLYPTPDLHRSPGTSLDQPTNTFTFKMFPPVL